MMGWGEAVQWYSYFPYKKGNMSIDSGAFSPPAFSQRIFMHLPEWCKVALKYQAIFICFLVCVHLE